MMRCLSKNPIDRATIRQLLEHEFLNKIDKYRWTITWTQKYLYFYIFIYLKFTIIRLYYTKIWHHSCL